MGASALSARRAAQYLVKVLVVVVFSSPIPVLIHANTNNSLRRAPRTVLYSGRLARESAQPGRTAGLPAVSIALPCWTTKPPS